MFKKITIAALASVSMCAFAQDSSMVRTSSTWSMSGDRAMMMDMNASHYEKRKMVEMRANEALSGADRYVLMAALDRAPTSVEHSLVNGLFGAHRQAMMLNDQMIAARFPVQDMTVVTTTTSASGTTATTTTTTTTTTDTTMSGSTMAMDMNDITFRPMRMVMQSSARPKMVDYMTATDILTSGLNEAQAGILRSWWMNTASEREKDVIVRLLEDSAGLADQIYYPSVYTRRIYSWSTR